VERLLASMLRTIIERSDDSGVERFTSRHDQAALQQLLIDGSRDGSSPTMSIDHRSELVLSLFGCTYRGNLTKSIKGFEYCRERWWAPMMASRVPNASAFLHWPRGRPRDQERVHERQKEECRAASDKACASSLPSEMVRRIQAPSQPTRATCTPHRAVETSNTAPTS
jgi:hypothetical protein